MRERLDAFVELAIERRFEWTVVAFTAFNTALLFAATWAMLAHPGDTEAFGYVVRAMMRFAVLYVMLKD